MSREIFQFVQRPKMRRSRIDLSYQNAFTCKLGELIPCYFEEVLPTDSAIFSAAPFIRASPLSAPIMGQIDVRMYYFYVPFNIIWTDFEEFITGGRDGLSSPVVPYLSAAVGAPFNGSGRNTLYDFFRLARTEWSSNRKQLHWNPQVSALLIRAYWKIYDDYFRDQNLSPSYFDTSQTNYISTGSGAISSLPGFNHQINGQYILEVASKCWDKDLFTSALPFAQRGAPVSIPVGDGEVFYRTSPDGPDNEFTLQVDATGKVQDEQVSGVGMGTGRLYSSSTGLQSFNINDLREASAIQRFLEFNAIGGSRYKEQVAMHFGGRVADYRLNRPEFICGMKTPVLSSQVLQQSQTNTDSVLGTQGGNLNASGVIKPRKFRFEEHGVVIGLMAITPKSSYSQGISRMNLKFDKFDYFFPYFENLGEQEIYNAELFAQGTPADMKQFGYGPRFYEYKHRENEVHGDFKDSLSYWLPQRKFSSLPGLNPDFIEINPAKEQSLNNIFAVTDSTQDQFYCVVQNVAKFVRPMSKYSKFLLR